MVLLPGEEMESGFGFLGKSLGAVITRGNFEVQASEFSRLVLVLDAKVRDRNLVVHNFVIEAVEIGVVAGIFGLDQAVIDRLPMGDELGPLKKPVGVPGERQNFGRVGRVPLDAALFDEPLPAKIAEVAVHLRAVAAV